MAKEPTTSGLPIDILPAEYGVQHFSDALRTFVAQYGKATPRYTAHCSDHDIQLNVNRVHVWHVAKFNTLDVQLGKRMTHDIAHAAQSTVTSRGATTAARYDTVFVNDTGAEAVGIDGLRVARLRLIFKIPDDLAASTFGGGVQPPEHLAYVEWFTRPRVKDGDHGMYPIAYSKDGNSGERTYAIIELSSVVRVCQLIPCFGAKVNRAWTSDTILDDCTSFLVSNWKDHLTYQTIY